MHRSLCKQESRSEARTALGNLPGLPVMAEVGVSRLKVRGIDTFPQEPLHKSGNLHHTP
jgi:hypothetical protein